jgi:hypothetical protein
MAAKKAATKKASKKEEAKPVAKPKLKVLRLNVKDGERYPMEIDAADLLTHINGEVGLGDIVVGHVE